MLVNGEVYLSLTFLEYDKYKLLKTLCRAKVCIYAYCINNIMINDIMVIAALKHLDRYTQFYEVEHYRRRQYPYR
jgi:hypothetical protein